ncbi:MAG: DUF2249 domain-containing protein [Terriglobia bacterium]
MTAQESNDTPKITSTIDVRTIAHQQRHPLIFRTYDTLKSGEGFILVVDHDPKPVFFELDFIHNGKFTWEYLQKGPELWRVQVAKN